MSIKPSITVIIPAYNSEKYIADAIDSVLNQSFKDYELIIINDGSTDNTENIVTSYANHDSRIKPLNQKNQGVSVARNRGIESAQGKYITFLDSDDYYDVSFLEKMYDAIEMNNCEVCYCGYNKMMPEGSMKIHSRFTVKNVLRDYILGNVRVHTTGWMVKKALLTQYQIEFKEGVNWGEDVEFFCMVLARTTKIAYVKEHLTNHRVDFGDHHLSSFSLDKADKDYDTIMRIVRNPIINKEKSIEKALVEYRLNALIINRLMNAVEKGYDLAEIKKYYEKYRNYIIKPAFNNGLKSIRLYRIRNRVKKIMNGVD